MSRSLPLGQQIAANLRKVVADPRFDSSQFWLTFSLMGEPSRLCEVAGKLSAEGWCNTEGWEGAFLYPKIEADRSAAAIIDMAGVVMALCADRDVEIINIDADTSPDVTQSKCITLYRA